MWNNVQYMLLFTALYWRMELGDQWQAGFAVVAIFILQAVCIVNWK